MAVNLTPRKPKEPKLPSLVEMHEGLHHVAQIVGQLQNYAQQNSILITMLCKELGYDIGFCCQCQKVSVVEKGCGSCSSCNAPNLTSLLTQIDHAQEANSGPEGQAARPGNQS